jgi:hypothetical protein
VLYRSKLVLAEMGRIGTGTNLWGFDLGLRSRFWGTVTCSLIRSRSRADGAQTNVLIMGSWEMIDIEDH